MFYFICFLQCQFVYCLALKRLRKHIQTCKIEGPCNFPNCKVSRRMMQHWHECRKRDCFLCMPMKQDIPNSFPPTEGNQGKFFIFGKNIENAMTRSSFKGTRYLYLIICRRKQWRPSIKKIFDSEK